MYLYIFIDFSPLARDCALVHLSHLLSFILVYDVTKMVTGLKLQSPKKRRKKRRKLRKQREEGG